MLGNVESDSLAINLTGNDVNTFDTYCVKMETMQECLVNGTYSSNVLNITGLVAGTNYTLHVYTVYKDVLSEHYSTIQSFTSK